MSTTPGNEFGITHETKREAHLDAVGWWWIGFATGWTVLLLAGMALLIVKRDAPSAKIRNLWVSFAAVATLHLYWVSVQLGYVIGPLAPGDAEFWIMGIYVPFGYALFHASNTRFLQVAQIQERYATAFSLTEAVDCQRMTSFDQGKSRGWRAWFYRFRYADASVKLGFWICCGMTVQILTLVTMFLISRKYHPSFGIPGTETHGTALEQTMQKGRGWEWWPSIAWQILWSWVYAPYNLWRSRKTKDTHGWRLQTICCCLAGLPASPMWLVALYAPGMAPVNKYWIPPQWLALSIMMIEIFTIFIPCRLVLGEQSISQELLDSIQSWEKMRKFSEASIANSGTLTLVGSEKSSFDKASKHLTAVTSEEVSKRLLTMAALEQTLETNPTRLQQFAALRDFSGENISFLTSVHEWKQAWADAKRPGSPTGDGGDLLVRQQFNRALSIYVLFISWETATVPVNLSHREYGKFQMIFEEAARLIYTADATDNATSQSGSLRTELGLDEDKKTGLPIDENTICDRVWYWGPIPERFTPEVFDGAENSVKYLVYTNTWPRYLQSNAAKEDVGYHQKLEKWRATLYEKARSIAGRVG